MTENEIRIINGKEIVLYREIETDLYRFSKDVVDMLFQAFEEAEQYRVIGTVEEFKALKENQCKCEDCAGCTVWKCDCANTRQQAIDEFVKKICEKYTEEERKGNYKQYCAEIKQNIADIAEQLKG